MECKGSSLQGPVSVMSKWIKHKFSSEIVNVTAVKSSYIAEACLRDGTLETLAHLSVLVHVVFIYCVSSKND